MNQPCELLQKCGFFMNYQDDSEVVKQGWIRIYCESVEKSEKCQRKKIRNQTGKPPSDNLSPTGKYLMSSVL